MWRSHARSTTQGDYTVDLESWPSGLQAAGKRIKDAGLQVGLHMISTGAQTCHGNPNPNDPSCAKVAIERPDVFVPQVSFMISIFLAMASTSALLITLSAVV